MIDLKPLRERWLEDEDTYDQLAQRVRNVTAEEAKRRGIQCTVVARAKEMSSLLKKALRKSYASPYEQIGDKAGARITLTYPDSVGDAERLVRETFDVQKYEDKSLELGATGLGYLGIHFDVTLPDALAAPNEELFRGKSCEVQLHTGAQSLWAGVAHQLTYKADQDPPPAILRAIYRLIALVEIFDAEVARSRRELLALSGFQEARILDELERHFYQLTARSFDRELSIDVISKLLPTLSQQEIDGFNDLLSRFVQSNREKLSEIFANYQEDTRHLLLSQPESLLIFERLVADSFVLRENWQTQMPIELLDGLVDVWGADA